MLNAPLHILDNHKELLARMYRLSVAGQPVYKGDRRSEPPQTPVQKPRGMCLQGLDHYDVVQLLEGSLKDAIACPFALTPTQVWSENSDEILGDRAENQGFKGRYLTQRLTDITDVLRNAQNADASIRTQAELQLQQFQQQNLAAYFLSLATQLADETKPADVRQIAGLIIKNALDAPSEARKAELIRAWSALDSNVKGQVQQLVLTALGSSVSDLVATLHIIYAFKAERN
eukprot:jgi/Botrbrau1/21311/Bobra.0184s0022.1